MIIVSSNLATNLIIDLVGAENVMKTLNEMGVSEIKVLRGVEDNKAFQKGLNNTTTAYGMAMLLERMAKGQAVNKQSSDEMIKVLLDQRFNEIIPTQLPKDVKVAHKTGWITALHHDAAIVYLPNGKKYILVLLSKNLGDEKAAVKVMAGVSLLVYNHFTRKK
jgi:beta-lactamase class A